MNNMLILRLLSEEVFDFNTGLTSARAAQLKQQFCGQFQSVHELCQEILVVEATIIRFVAETSFQLKQLTEFLKFQIYTITATDNQQNRDMEGDMYDMYIDEDKLNWGIER